MEEDLDMNIEEHLNWQGISFCPSGTLYIKILVE